MPPKKCQSFTRTKPTKPPAVWQETWQQGQHQTFTPVDRESISVITHQAKDSKIRHCCHQHAMRLYSVSPNNCSALLPQAFLWGKIWAALTCRRVDYLMLSCNLWESGLCKLPLWLSRTYQRLGHVSIQIGRQVTVYTSVVLIDYKSSCDEWLTERQHTRFNTNKPMCKI